MKYLLKTILLISLSLNIFAQNVDLKTDSSNWLSKSSFFLEGGANLPAFGWQSNYGYAKTGLEIGFGGDYYFHKNWGIGLDIRHHRNGVYRKQNTINLDNSQFYDTSYHSAFVNPSINYGKWTGNSLAIGPTYKTNLFDNKFTIEAYIKGGIALYKLPKLVDKYTILGQSAGGFQDTTEIIIFDGYTHENPEKMDWKMFGIVGLRVGYNLNQNWMVYGTVNYKTTLIDRDDYYYQYQRAVPIPGLTIKNPLKEPIKEGTLIDGELADKTSGYEDTEMAQGVGSIQSFGVLVGVKFTPSFNKKKKKRRQPAEVIKQIDTVVIVKTDTVKLKNTVINVKVKDEPSGAIIPNADVALVDEKGNIVSTAKSDAFGMAKFEGIEPGNYTTKAMVYGKSTTIDAIKKSDFEKSLINKTVLYQDLNFILKGKTIDLDTKRPISDVLVSLENKTKQGVKQATSDQDGDFTFGLSPETNYQVIGTKNGLFSNTNKVSTVGLKRSQTLFVDLELGLQNPCGKSIKLNNIYYDLDKWFIREEAKVELDRVVAFMKNNPDVMIELSSHTDCRASNKYNKTLSQKRATAAVNYIVSQGADRTKIKGIGYGETKLLNKCADGVNCSEEEHQLNRRTEVKVICQ